MRNKKFIIVVPWLSKFPGGAELNGRLIAENLYKRGYEVNIFTTCCKSQFHDWWNNDYKEGVYDKNGLPIHRFKVNKNTKEKYILANHKLAKGEQLSEKEKENFFVCGINSNNLVKNIGPYIKKGYEIICTPYFQGLPHSLINTYPHKISLIPCLHDEIQLYWNQTKKLLSHAKYVFYNTPEEKMLAIKAHGLSIGRKLVESSIPGVGVELSSDSGDLPEKLSKTDYFVYVGKKDRGKNVDKLCKWYKNYIDIFKTNTKLVFIGSGDHSLIPKDDHFIDIGYADEMTKYSVIKNSKGLINLSENESFSIVMMEAWLLGIPVIVSEKCDVTCGHAKRAHGGLYAESALEFAYTIDYLLKEKTIAKKLADNGKKYVEENFSFDTVIYKYIETFNK